MMNSGNIAGLQRRKHVRRAVRLRVRIELGTRTVEAMTENISPGGAFFECELPHDCEALFATIDLPNGKPMRVRARICWRRDAPGAGVGVAFEQFVHDEPTRDLAH